MSTGVSRVLEGLAERQLRTIPISDIRCVDFKVPVQEGWGGRPIEYFPPYQFFALYHAGEKQAAMEGMQDWYYKRIIVDNYINLPKNEGGMAGGSFFEDLAAMHQVRGLTLSANMDNVDDGIVREAIHQKVVYRFSIFESIRKHGFSFTWDFVRLVPQGGLFYLRGGHHRVAALAVCGSTSVRATVSESMYLKLLRKSATGLLGK